MFKGMLTRVYDELRRITPPNARRWFKSQFWFTPVTKRLFGTGVYSNSYYRDVERLELTSVPTIAAWIAGHLRPRRVIDVGCGPGHMMVALKSQGIDVFGVDLSDAALRLSTRKGLNVARFDLCKPGDLPGAPYDLAVCCEVAEHLEERFAVGLLAKLVNAAPVVFMTAAEPGAGGIHHHNEQPNDYWVELMENAGMHSDWDATASARECFSAANVISYLAKPMIFRRQFNSE
jgi:SAM-dependent methyltransferase